MPERLRLLRQWLEQSCGIVDATVTPASADASFRRYFRVTRPDASTYVAMDAPPDREDCRPFLAVAERLAAAGVHVPAIVAEDVEQGFLLLEDLGDRPYLGELTLDSADRLYGDAVTALLGFQCGAAFDGLPRYDEGLLRAEMGLFPEWLLGRHLGLTLDADERAMLAATETALVTSALEQPVVFVHRDYHSRNLMWVDERNPGVIDFQDAVAGPVTYDLVSMLRDCYVRWPEDRVETWLTGYLQSARRRGMLTAVSDEQFRCWFDLMGVQRHLKAAGIFARLNHRDGKPGYLGDLPRTLGYVADIGLRHDATRALAEFVANRVLPLL